MSRILVTSRINCMDEFDVCGFKIFASEDDFDRFMLEQQNILNALNYEEEEYSLGNFRCYIRKGEDLRKYDEIVDTDYNGILPDGYDFNFLDIFGYYTDGDIFDITDGMFGKASD